MEEDYTSVYLKGVYDERDKWKKKVKEKIKELKDKDLEIYDTDSEDVIIAKYEERAVLDFCNRILEES